MGDRQMVAIDFAVPPQQDIEIEPPRPLLAGLLPAVIALDALELVEQLARAEARLYRGAGVEELGLVLDDPGLGSVRSTDGLDRGRRQRADRVEGGDDLLLGLAEICAEPEMYSRW